MAPLGAAQSPAPFVSANAEKSTFACPCIGRRLSVHFRYSRVCSRSLAVRMVQRVWRARKSSLAPHRYRSRSPFIDGSSDRFSSLCLTLRSC
eukprot:3758955-Prymnesium_polylepis.1